MFALELKLGKFKILKAVIDGSNKRWLKPLQWKWVSTFLATAGTEVLELDEAWGDAWRNKEVGQKQHPEGVDELKVRSGEPSHEKNFLLSTLLSLLPSLCSLTTIKCHREPEL